MSCECAHPQLPHVHGGGFVCKKCGCTELKDTGIEDSTGGNAMACRDCWLDYIRTSYEDQFGKPKEASD